MEKIELINNIKTFTVRSLLVLSLFTAPVFSIGCSQRFETKKAQQELSELKGLKDRLFEAYQKSPEIIFQDEFFHQIQDLFVLEEYIGYCEREEKGIDKKELDQTVIQDFLGEIIQGQSLKIQDLQSVIDLIVNIKLVFQEKIGRPDSYEKNHPNFVDPAMEKAFQCRSGTENILYMLSRIPGVEKTVRLVYIHTNGHVLPGFIFQEKLFGIESTTSGSGLSEFGLIRDIKVPVNVVDYRHSLSDEVIGGIPKDKKEILINPDKEVVQIDSVSETEEHSWKGVHSSQYSFGQSKVAPGRKNLNHQDRILPENYRKDFSERYSESENIQKQDLPENIKQALIDFNLNYQQILNNFWNRHIDLCSQPPVAEDDFREQARIIMSEFKIFLEENPAEKDFNNLKEIMSSDGLRPSVKSPNEIHDTILHNINVTLNKKYNL